MQGLLAVPSEVNTSLVVDVYYSRLTFPALPHAWRLVANSLRLRVDVTGITALLVANSDAFEASLLKNQNLPK